MLLSLLFTACALISDEDLSARLDLDGDGIARPDDCDDADDAVGAATTQYADADADGFGGPVSATACATSAGYVSNNTDCDDVNAAVNPAVSETCDGLDDDCDGATDEDDAADATLWYPDGDGDGFGTDGETQRSCGAPLGYAAETGDCDDIDATINPGEREACDGRDEDCSGTVDDPRWYIDADGDDYGAPGAYLVTCLGPSGYAERDTDCDDANPEVHPGGQEVCDDLNTDEDCDGFSDADDPSATGQHAAYLDADGDGYGDRSQAIPSECELTPGYSWSEADCDDGDAAISPAATEICYNGIDGNCDGVSDDDCDLDGSIDSTRGGDDCDDADAAVNPGALEVCSDRVDNNCDGDLGGECAFTGVQSLADASVVLRGAEEDGQFGDKVGVGDFDGDGAGDVFVVGWYSNVNYVFTGPLGSDMDSSMASFDEDISAEQTPYAVSSADIDGDGTSDVVLGLAGYSGSEGGYPGGVRVISQILSSPVETIVQGPDSDGRMGNDADVLCGASYEPCAIVAGSPFASGAAGRIDVISPGPIADLAIGANYYTGADSGDYAGWAVSSSGDVDGDGLSDVLIGAIYRHEYDGAAYLVLGGTSGAVSLADAEATFTSDTAGGRLGYTLAILPDASGDGYGDLAIGAYYGLATAYVEFGPAPLSGSIGDADVRVDGHSDGSYAGVLQVASVGDLDGNGLGDLAVSDEGQYGYGTGRTFIALSPLAGYIEVATMDGILDGQAASDHAGTSIAGADLDGDGFSDMVIGAPGNDGYSPDAGAAYLVFGGGS